MRFKLFTRKCKHEWKRSITKICTVTNEITYKSVVCAKCGEYKVIHGEESE